MSSPTPALMKEINAAFNRNDCKACARGPLSLSDHSAAGYSQRMQDADRPADIQTLSEPPGHRRSRVNINRRMPSSQRFAGRGRNGRRRRHFGQRPPVRPPEFEVSVRQSLHLITLFVNRAMVSTAEHREVGQRRRASLRPVPDVMALPERQPAPGEATAAIAMLECSA